MQDLLISATPASPTAKRKHDTQKTTSPDRPGTPVKRARLSRGAKTKNELPPLWENKGKTFRIKQKLLSWEGVNSCLLARLAFAKDMVALGQPNASKLSSFPDEHRGVVAALAHESDKTANALVLYVKKMLLEYIQGAVLEAEDSESEETKTVPIAGKIPNSIIQTLIDTIAKRINYGLDMERDDVRDLVERAGYNTVPVGLQLYRWEVQELGLLPTELHTKLLKRQNERKDAQTELITWLSSLEKKDLAYYLESTTKAKPATSSHDNKENKENLLSHLKDQEKNIIETENLAKEQAKEAERKMKADAKAEKEKEKIEKTADSLAKRIEKEKQATERDEKRSKKENDRKEKEEKDAKQKASLAKSSGLLTGFLVKKSAKPALTIPQNKDSQTDFEKSFKPFFTKADATVAPINRFLGNALVSEGVESDSTLMKEDALKEFKSRLADRQLPYRPYPKPPISVRKLVHKINDGATMGSDVERFSAMLKDSDIVWSKTLVFHEDYRPGYCGTWSKISRVVGPRTPFGKDTAILRYDYDSEAEWDAGDAEMGDDVNSDAGEDEGESDGELSDDWMCADDEVEYESKEGRDAEIPNMDADIIFMDEVADARKKILDREKKSKTLKDAKKKRLAGPLLPVIKGPLWEPALGHVKFDGFEPMKIQFIHGQEGINPFTWKAPRPVKDEAPVNTVEMISDISLTTPAVTTNGKQMPPQLMDRFRELVTGSNKTTPVLIDFIYAELGSESKALVLTDGSAFKLTKSLITSSLKDNCKKVKGVWTVVA